MLYYLLYPLAEAWKALNVFRYITFRSIYAAITAFIFCVVLGPMLIKFLKKKGVEQAIRQDGPGAHLKNGGHFAVRGLVGPLGTTGGLDFRVCFTLVRRGGFLGRFHQVLGKKSQGHEFPR